MTSSGGNFTIDDLQHVQAHLDRFGDLQQIYEKADSPPVTNPGPRDIGFMPHCALCGPSPDLRPC